MGKSYKSEASYPEALKQDSVDEWEVLTVQKTWIPVPSNHLEMCRNGAFTDLALTIEGHELLLIVFN